MRVDDRPCGSCPYRRDTPSGLWSFDEYEKLRAYDDESNPCLAFFLCHQSNATGIDTACRGWLSVASESIAVRLAMIKGTVTSDQVYEAPTVALYASGNEAADAGQAEIAEPDDKARRMIRRMVEKGVGRV